MLSIAHTYGAVSCNLKSASETSNAATSRAMVQKAFIDAFFHIFCVALVVAALAQSSCIDEARESVEKGHGKPIPGGYQVIENPKDDADVQAIAVATIDYYNEQSNDPRRFEIPDNGTVEAYRQSEVGQKFCVQFTLVSVGCKNSAESDCGGNEITAVCAVSAYKKSTDQAPQLDTKATVCEKGA